MQCQQQIMPHSTGYLCTTHLEFMFNLYDIHFTLYNYKTHCESTSKSAISKMLVTLTHKIGRGSDDRSEGKCWRGRGIHKNINVKKRERGDKRQSVYLKVIAGMLERKLRRCEKKF